MNGRPCPFCGSEDLEPMEWPGGFVSGYCKTCGARGPLWPSEPEAWEAWDSASRLREPKGADGLPLAVGQKVRAVLTGEVYEIVEIRLGVVPVIAAKTDKRLVFWLPESFEEIKEG